MTLRDLLRVGEKELAAADIPEAELNAWYLFAYCFAMDRSRYFLQCDSEAGEEKTLVYRQLLECRKTRMPLEYITHETEFMGLPFYVDEHVLIPRQDTECLVEDLLPVTEGRDILDLCCGSGCIGISLAVLGGCKTVTLSDISGEALQVAAKNADQNGVRVNVVCSDLFDRIEGRFDIIVSNPPYIPTEQIGTLMPEVREYEPHLALNGADDGLMFYRNIVSGSRYYLRDQGILAFETGCDQGEDILAMMEGAGFCQLEIKKDLAGLDRIARGVWRRRRDNV